MNNLVALTVRELKSFWYTWIAYLVGIPFLLLQGFVFWLLVAALNDPRIDASWTISQAFFGGQFWFWLSAIGMAPFLTMRSFSEEKRTGTIEFLLTAPVTDTQVVLAKFLGAWLAYIALWAFTLPYFLMLRRFMPLDWGPIATGYLGTWLLGGVLIAIGVLASSLTRNQIIAVVLSFVTIVLLFSIGVMDFFIKDPETSKFIQYLNLAEHLRTFSKGVIDTRPAVFYLSFTSICLFLTGRVISSSRWRS